MDNWAYLETLAQQRQVERERLGERLRQVRLAKAPARCPGRSQLASFLVAVGVKLDAEAARTATAQGEPAAGARRAA